jgi:hypothetical protein
VAAAMTMAAMKMAAMTMAAMTMAAIGHGANLTEVRLRA